MQRIDSIFCNQLVKAHLFQGKTNHCGPYSAAIVLKAFGKPVDIDLLANSAIGWKKNKSIPVFRRIPNWATFPWGLVDILRENGFAASWRVLTPKERLMECLLQDIIVIVVTGNYFPLWAHYSILVSISEGMVGLVDPANQETAISWLAEQEFMLRWSKLGRTIIQVFPKTSFLPQW